MAVRWVRWLAPFQTLSRPDQLLLMQESWKELFLLYLAQWSTPWDLGAILTQRLARNRLADDLLLSTEVKTMQVNYNRYRRFSSFFNQFLIANAGINGQVPTAVTGR